MRRAGLLGRASGGAICEHWRRLSTKSGGVMLNGRCVVVTGAAGNLGTAVSARLQREGASVFALVRKPTDAVAGAQTHVAELESESAVEGAYEAAIRKFGAVWGSIHCAGAWAGGAVSST